MTDKETRVKTLNEILEWLNECSNSVFALSASETELRMLSEFKKKIKSMLPEDEIQLLKRAFKNPMTIVEKKEKAMTYIGKNVICLNDNDTYYVTSFLKINAFGDIWMTSEGKEVQIYYDLEDKWAQIVSDDKTHREDEAIEKVKKYIGKTTKCLTTGEVSIITRFYKIWFGSIFMKNSLDQAVTVFESDTNEWAQIIDIENNDKASISDNLREPSKGDLGFDSMIGQSIVFIGNINDKYRVRAIYDEHNDGYIIDKSRWMFRSNEQEIRTDERIKVLKELLEWNRTHWNDDYSLARNHVESAINYRMPKK
jgi:hypothetical protein